MKLEESPQTQLQHSARLALSWVQSNKARLKGDPVLEAKLQLLLEQVPELKLPVMDARASQKQLDFAEDFRARRHRRYAALGGNRSGKTVVAGGMCFAWWLWNRAQNNNTYWCVAPTFEKSIGQQKFLWECLPRWMFGRSWDPKNGFDGQRPIIPIKLPAGRGTAVLNFKTSEQQPSTFESDAIHGAWCDEHLPLEIWQRLIPRTIDNAAWIIYSDIPEQDWHYWELHQAKPEAKVLCQIFAMSDNQNNLPPGEIEIAAAGMSTDQQEMRIHGRFRRLQGVVYREFDRDRHVCRPFQIPAEWPRFTALDYGLANPTAHLWFAIAPNECVYVYREYYQPFGNVRLHAAAINAMSGGADGKVEKYARRLIDPHAKDKDPRQDLSILDQYILAGIKMTGWPYVQVAGEHAMVEKVKRRLENGQFKVFDTCLNTIREFMAWKYKCDKEGNPLASDAYENDNNHALDTIKGFIGTNPCYSVPKIEVY